MNIVPAVRKLDFTEIPVVDVSPFVSGDETYRAEAVAALSDACENIGFVYVKNHGVPRDVLDAVVRETKLFFDLPHAEKMSVAVEKSPQFRGFLPLEYGGTRAGGKDKKGPNLQEAFIIMPDRPVGEKNPLDGPNQWPETLPSLKSAMLAYDKAITKFGYQMLKAFSLTLGQKPDFFDAYYTRPTLMLKLNHYPPQPPLTSAQKIGVKGHTDGGGFTILWQDDQGGLEILNKHGDWVGVPPIDGTFVINIGDMMQRWSGNRFISTQHRVVNVSGNERYSIPLFMNPDFSAVIKAVNGDDAEEPYESGKFLFEKYHRIYPQ